MNMSANPTQPNPLTCYVRVIGEREAGYVEFEFAIGDPELAVELVLHVSAFEEFCARHRVVHLDDEAGERLDYQRMKWRFGAPGITH